MASSTQEALLERTPSIIDLEIERGTLSRSRSGSREFLSKAAEHDEDAMSQGTALQFVFLGFVSLSLLVALRLLRREPAAEAAEGRLDGHRVLEPQGRTRLKRFPVRVSRT